MIKETPAPLRELAEKLIARHGVCLASFVSGGAASPLHYDGAISRMVRSVVRRMSTMQADEVKGMRETSCVQYAIQRKLEENRARRAEAVAAVILEIFRQLRERHSDSEDELHAAA